jgi:hypothetical protein
MHPSDKSVYIDCKGVTVAFLDQSDFVRNGEPELYTLRTPSRESVRTKIVHVRNVFVN